MKVPYLISFGATASATADVEATCSGAGDAGGALAQPASTALNRSISRESDDLMRE